MDLTGEHTIAAPRADVWAALNDPDVLKECIPGCQSLEKLSDAAFKATATLAIGPVRATYHGQVTLSEIVAPERYVIRGEGQGGAAGFAKGSAEVTLHEADGATRLCYVVKAEVGGKLAQLGGRLIDATAKKLARDFFATFCEVVAPTVGPPSDDPAKARRRGLFKRLFNRA